MTTIDLECPSCHRVGSVPKDRANGRLVCKKCFSVFHMSPLGRPVLGEPPAERRAHDDHGQGQSHPHPASSATEMPTLSEMIGLGGAASMKKLGAVLALLLAVLVYYNAPTALSSFIGHGDSVTPTAEKVVAAFADQDLETVKKLALPSTLDEVISFYNKTEQTLLEVKREAVSGKVVSSVIVLPVAEENLKADVVGVFTGAKGRARDEKIADAAGTNDAAKSLHQTMFYFTRDKDGRWKLDGRRCLNPGT